MKNLFFALTALVALLTGCAEFRDGDQPADSVTKPTFFFGELRSSEIATIEKAWNGVKASLKELNFTVKSSDRDLLQATIIAVGDDKDIKIHLEETSLTTTEIRIRAGKVGDKALAEKVMATIHRHL